MTGGNSGGGAGTSSGGAGINSGAAKRGTPGSADSIWAQKVDAVMTVVSRDLLDISEAHKASLHERELALSAREDALAANEAAHEEQFLRRESVLAKREHALEAAGELAERYSNMVTLNVGGEIFCTTHSTLTSHGGFFSALLSGRHPLPIDNHGRIFLDRSADVFGQLLHFMRGNTVDPNLPFLTQSRLRTEADFYGIDALAELLDQHAVAVASGLSPPLPLAWNRGTTNRDLSITAARVSHPSATQNLSAFAATGNCLRFGKHRVMLRATSSVATRLTLNVGVAGAGACAPSRCYGKQGAVMLALYSGWIFAGGVSSGPQVVGAPWHSGAEITLDLDCDARLLTFSIRDRAVAKSVPLEVPLPTECYPPYSFAFDIFNQADSLELLELS